MRPLLLLLIIVLVASCGCVGTKPTHDFKINETRYFDFVYDDLHYGGNLKWNGEHFYIKANGYGERDGFFVTVHIHGMDNDSVFQISSPGSGLPSHVERHADFSRTVLLDKMIRNRVDKPGVNESH